MYMCRIIIYVLTCIHVLHLYTRLAGFIQGLVSYTNIDLKLRNKLHGPIHCKIGVTCVYNGHVTQRCFILCCNNTTI